MLGLQTTVLKKLQKVKYYLSLETAYRVFCSLSVMRISFQIYVLSSLLGVQIQKPETWFKNEILVK